MSLVIKKMITMPMFEQPLSSKTLEESLTIVLDKSREGPLSVKEIFEALATKGTDVFLLFLCLPFCQPIQFPGMSTPFGIVITLIGLRMAFRKRTWIPKFFLEKKISSKIINAIVTKSLWLLKKIRRFFHPRMQWMCHPGMRIPTGLIIFLMGLFMAIPLPIPMGNLPAAWAIAFISLGLLEHDGLFILLGYAIFALGITALILLCHSLSRH